MCLLSPEMPSTPALRMRGKPTKSKKTVRQTAQSSSLPFRLYRRDIFGSPDMVFPTPDLAALVHGGLWHRHAGCRKALNPELFMQFWNAKFVRNALGDQLCSARLRNLGRDVEVVLECEASPPKWIEGRPREFRLFDGKEAA